MNKRYIINADDFGKTQSINRAICYGFENGLITHTTIMMNMPYWKEGLIQSKNQFFCDKVGLHLNLDEGVPLTENIKNISLFCDSQGVFNGKFKSSLHLRLLPLTGNARKYCEEEMAKQLKTFCDTGFTYLHIDSHHYVHLNNSILSILLPLANDYGFKSMRIAGISSVDGLLRSLYKRRVNQRIRGVFCTTDCFFSDLAAAKEALKSTACSFELMVHPDYINGQYVNVISRRDCIYESLDMLDIIKE